MTTDRTPPQDIPAEQAVLGGILLSKNALAEVADILKPTDFYKPAHEAIYAAALHLDNMREPADAVTLAAELTRRGELTRFGGAPYLHTLMNSVPTAANAGYYADIVREQAKRRRIIEAGTRVVSMGYATDNAADLDDITERAVAELRAVADDAGEEYAPAGEGLEDMLATVEAAAKGGSGPVGVPTGLIELDELTNGLHPGQMIIIAARPAVGKSTLGLDLARAASIKQGLTSIIFSLEMSRQEVQMRLASAEARVSLHHMRTGAMTDDDWSRIGKSTGRISAAPLFIDDSPNMSLPQIRSTCRRLKERNDLRLVVVDYLQLISPSAGRRPENRQQEVSEMSRGLKLLAKELEIPVVAICQLNRGPEQRTDKRPVMSDLRESGSLEQDADVVILLHREDTHVQESPRTGEADLIIAKHRNGPTKTLTVAFQGHYSRFVDMARG